LGWLLLAATILEWYWITECSPVISINKENENKPWSVGKLIKWIDVKILDLEDNTRFLSKWEHWLILVSGKNVFDWYLDSSIKSPFIVIDNLKYYNTWDIGYIDEEWYLFITWRLKRFIKIAWEMISLPMIENVLNKKYWTEMENVLAVEWIEEKNNIKIVLFTILDLSIKQVNIYLREEGISNLIKISEIKKLDEIPTLWTGKIDYKWMKDLYSLI
jgi:long-subunit acyl-CoA synthetase (AMP-forming)